MFRHHCMGGVCVMMCLALLSAAPSASACDACGCTFNAKRSSGTTAVGATVITPTAGTLGAGHGFAGVLVDHQAYRTIPAEHANELADAGHDVHDKRHEEFYTLAGGYGVSERADLYLSLPVVRRSSLQTEDTDRLGQGERAVGVGDLRLVGKYRFWTEGVSAALVAGIKAPTGETSAQDRSGAKFEQELQSGSGSWDGTVGLTTSRSFRRHWTLASAVQYTARGEGAGGLKQGDVFRHDVGISCAWKPLGTNPNVSAVLELETQWVGRDHSRTSDKVLDSGGTVVLVSPGLSADLARSVAAFVGAPIPIHQDLGGAHQKLRYEVIGGVSWHF